MTPEILGRAVVTAIVLLYAYLIVGIMVATVCYSYLARHIRISDIDRLDPNFRTRIFCRFVVTWLPLLLRR